MAKQRKNPPSSKIQTDPYAQRARRETVSLVVSTACHMAILVAGAAIYMGGGVNQPTVITTSWADEAAAIVDVSEPVELIDVATGGGLKADQSAAVTAAAAANSGSAATAAGLEVAPISATLGGAFFGAGSKSGGAHAKRIVYIVDASGSMDYRLIRQSRFQRVKSELENSILSLHESQQFAVILFNDQARSQSRRVLKAATDRNKNSVISWIMRSEAGGDTKPLGAIKRALRLRPDTIYFLTDGVFQPVQAAALLKKQKGLTVHTFTLGDSSGEAIMRRVAEANGGQYKFVDGRETSADESTASTGSGAGAGMP